ncbi:S8 family peptidase [Streptomyces sp. CBMA152]|uniref:S8 family peptidase n=1 Tax=Streptomyces sp. CBMA152 TaxID=1896312 RepID=UPI0016600D5A|nr:S8 family peptidase [Streptomyces sp. CBMA152]MBD0744828.1 serine protease [Streptomyces sp. CBMA152]
MGRTHTGRLRAAGALTALVTAAALSCALPAQAAPPTPLPPPEGRVLGADAPGAVGGSYIVTLKDSTGAPTGAGRSIAAKYGAHISRTYETALNGYAVHVDAEHAGELAADPAVASVVQDTAVSLDDGEAGPADRTAPPDPTPQQPSDWPPGQGAGVTAYVIDTGIRTTHREFGGRASSGWDFVDDDADAEDGSGHGTHVAATLAGATYGVAKRADVVAVRVLDDHGVGTTAQVIAGIDWVARNARRPAVANLSLGGAANPELDQAVRNAIAAGVTFTVAAGNEGAPAARYSPARVPEAVTVGASDRSGARAAFSNWGPALDLFAPGVSVTSAWNTDDTASRTLTGTSMAAPYAAGAAALYLGGHPSATPAEVSDALVARSATGRITDAGPGSPDRLLQVTGQD